MSHHFEIKFGNALVAKGAHPAFGAVNEQYIKRDGELGAVFCQLKQADLVILPGEKSDKLHLIGSYLPPKWCDRIKQVLLDYEAEQKQEEERSSVLRRRK